MQCYETENIYAMMKLNVPKRVTLPNGRTFVVRYKTIPRDQLPPNIVMRIHKGLHQEAGDGEEEHNKGKGFLTL